MRRFVLCAALALGASCGPPPEPPPPPVKPPPPLPALPDLKPGEDQLKDDFIKLPDAGPSTFGWDLKVGTLVTYLARQQSEMVLVASGNQQSVELTYRTQWKGAVRIDGGGTRGDLLYFATPLSQTINGHAVSSEELQKISRIEARYQVKDTGEFSPCTIERGQEHPRMELFFALPRKELKEGERETKEIHLADAASQYHGRQEILHAGRRKVERFECTKLWSTVDLEIVPPGKQEDGLGRLVGIIAAYYDPKSMQFIRIDAFLTMAVHSRYETSPTDPKMDRFWTLNRVKAESRITITREGS
ncbi:MAG TPA: hypothetical protein VJU16_06375 [Planctomycetota bacterium]|nr:hypothetical protein [Planctomycetota bacterium]